MHMKTDKSPSPRMKRLNGRRQEHLPSPEHPAVTPDIRPLESSTTAAQPPSAYRPRSGPTSPDIRPFPSSQISGLQPGNPDPSEPEGNKPAALARTSGCESPDIGPDARTSGLPCLRTVKGRGPCSPS
uniref:Uncharacterized protein n=1 Tax=Triticum urartu TaxID=4572 RepID=A0A8R7UDI3_TRIUA